jgi:hypothetical protein
MLMVELYVPRYEWKRIIDLIKKSYKDVVIEMTKARASGIIRIFIKDCPKGWWLAMKLSWRGLGKIYMLKRVDYIDIPSVIIELSKKRIWKPEYEDIIEKELRKWGLKES